MRRIILIICITCVYQFACAQENDTVTFNSNVIGIKTGFIYNRGYSYYLNPYYLRRFKYISVKSGLFYGSDIWEGSNNYHLGVNVGCQMLFFRKSKLVQPYSEISLLFIGTNAQSTDNSIWNWGGGFLLGNGIQFKIERFVVGGGVDFGIIAYYSAKDEIDQALVYWIIPTLHFSYSFK